MKLREHSDIGNFKHIDLRLSSNIILLRIKEEIWHGHDQLFIKDMYAETLRIHPTLSLGNWNKYSSSFGWTERE